MKSFPFQSPTPQRHAADLCPAPLPSYRYRAISALSLACLLFGLASCATVNVKPDPEGLTREGIESARRLALLVKDPADVLDELAVSSGVRLENALNFDRRKQTVDAAAFYLKTALDVRSLLLERGGEFDEETRTALLSLHNISLGRFAEHWADDPRRRTDTAHRFTCEGSVFEIAESSTSDFTRGIFDHAVAASSLKGKGIVKSARPGIGAPLVAMRMRTPERAEEMTFFPERGMFVPATIVVENVREISDADGTRSLVTLNLKNPALHETVTIEGRELPLAANYSAAIELLLTGRNGTLWGLGGFFQADKRAAKSGIKLLEPYDPERIPLILTHGLASVPIIWKDLIPALMSDPDISRHYQVMAFSYPSAYSIAESALLFREQLAALRAKYDPQGRDPLSNNMVAAGHSMGGVLTYVLVTDFDDNLWNQISDTPLDELPLSAENKELARKLVYFDPDPGITRAIYMSAPHGGAAMAQAGLAVWISRLASLPKQMLATTGSLIDDLRDTNALDDLKVDFGKNITSVQSLDPDSPIVKALAISPYKEGVIYHSIIGDRGKGDTPNSSDGAVEYSSSHQEGAASELIVPTPHASYAHPDTIAEVKRILRLHAKAAGMR